MDKKSEEVAHSVDEMPLRPVLKDRNTIEIPNRSFKNVTRLADTPPKCADATPNENAASDAVLMNDAPPQQHHYVSSNASSDDESFQECDNFADESELLRSYAAGSTDDLMMAGDSFADESALLRDTMYIDGTTLNQTSDDNQHIDTDNTNSVLDGDRTIDMEDVDAPELASQTVDMTDQTISDLVIEDTIDLGTIDDTFATRMEETICVRSGTSSVEPKHDETVQLHVQSNAIRENESCSTETAPIAGTDVEFHNVSGFAANDMSNVFTDENTVDDIGINASENAPQVRNAGDEQNTTFENNFNVDDDVNAAETKAPHETSILVPSAGDITSQVGNRTINSLSAADQTINVSSTCNDTHNVAIVDDNELNANTTLENNLNVDDDVNAAKTIESSILFSSAGDITSNVGNRTINSLSAADQTINVSNTCNDTDQPAERSALVDDKANTTIENNLNFDGGVNADEKNASRESNAGDITLDMGSLTTIHQMPAADQTINESIACNQTVNVVDAEQTSSDQPAARPAIVDEHTTVESTEANISNTTTPATTDNDRRRSLVTKRMSANHSETIVVSISEPRMDVATTTDGSKTPILRQNPILSRMLRSSPAVATQLIVSDEIANKPMPLEAQPLTAVQPERDYGASDDDAMDVDEPMADSSHSAASASLNDEVDDNQFDCTNVIVPFNEFDNLLSRSQRKRAAVADVSNRPQVAIRESLLRSFDPLQSSTTSDNGGPQTSNQQLLALPIKEETDAANTTETSLGDVPVAQNDAAIIPPTENEADCREKELLQQLAHKESTIVELTRVIQEYEKTLAEVLAEKARDDANKSYLIALQSERDTYRDHLASLELTFSDLHTKYERSKVLAIQLKANADQLEADNNMYKHQLKAQTASFEKLKKHAAEKLEFANTELESLSKAQKIDAQKLKIQLKRAEIAQQSFIEQLEHKTKENANLQKMLDELM